MRVSTSTWERALSRSFCSWVARGLISRTIPTEDTSSRTLPDSKPFLDAANLGWVRAPKGLSKTHDKEVRLAEARHAEAAERYAAHVEQFHSERERTVYSCLRMHHIT